MLAESPEGNVVQLSTGGQVILPKLGRKFQVHEIAVVRLFLLWPGNKARPMGIVCVKECPQLVHFIWGGGGALLNVPHLSMKECPSHPIQKLYRKLRQNW